MKAHFVVLLTCIGVIAVSLIISEQMETPVLASASASGYTLVLDAGHGGEDGGAVSAAGSKESDINLSIVLKIDQLMGFCGISAVLTREDDRSIHNASAETLREKKVSDIHNRVALIESIDHAILLSVHQNSYQDSRYSGAQVFYGAAGDSQSWGEQTQELLRSALDTGNDRAAKRIPDTVYLMNHISCPAILVECGFMSNGEEASLLLTSEYQKKVAAVLAGACLQYFAS